ncbi:MAG: hypothetical protein CL477_06800 [Acidobacteria bacterium]|jgi:hypothetical protein|nr:hypothetical protein [Acidobacteriota bacterium]|tara:strand:- start:175 stop:420 length:246 start_codon:yes stop_codon:yes gene_type:complete
MDNDGAEIAVLLWTFLACEHAGIPPEVVFHPYGYKGDSEWLIEQFSSGNYIGLPLLQWYDMVSESDDPETGLPRVIRWVRE